MRIRSVFWSFFSLIILVLFHFTVFGQKEMHKVADRKMQSWVDSVYNSLSTQEKVGQLIFARANLPNQPYMKEVDEYIKKYNIGGVVFFAGDPVNQALQTNRWNQLAKTPLFISIDAEWGLGMRLKRTISYPLQMTLGAIPDYSQLYIMGSEIGKQCKRLGIQINFAPVVDVNNNPENPVIGMRSFGEDPISVSNRGYAYMQGMQDQGIIACAKHFPGHGDTEKDSHVTLPSVTGSKRGLENTELVPFQYLINQGVDAIMVAHLSIPALDDEVNRPSSLSEEIITKKLKRDMGFEGLIITDGLDMKGVTQFYGKGEVALEALKAGDDILLIPDDIPASVSAILLAIENETVSLDRVEESCKKILKYKYLTGVWEKKEIDTTNLIKDLNKPSDVETMKNLFTSAITMVKNENIIVPISQPDTLKTALIVLGTEATTDFELTLELFMPVDVFHLEHTADVNAKQNIINQLPNYNLIIIAVVNTNILASKQFGISESDIQFVDFVSRSKPVILDLFASPYSLNLFTSVPEIKSIIVSYQDKPNVQKASAEIILGMQTAGGLLPVSAGGFTVGTGLATKQSRLTYGNPADMGIDTIILKKVDSIALKGIELKAYPGCQVLAAKDGVIFYQKSFGYQTYDKLIPIDNSSIYDLASLTKILATVPSLMLLSDQNLINIDDILSDYLFYLRNTNKESLGFREVLSHQAGLEPWIPYYENTILNSGWDTVYYRSIIEEEFPVRVAQNMYIRENYNYQIYQQIIHSPLGPKEYAYSDLGYYLFKDMVEDISETPFDEYVYENFYYPLRLKRLRYKPRRYFELQEIVPTENDQVFRHQLLRGDVHDQGAAMMGGIAGHAGLFGNAYDVAVVMQMYLNGGNYGGRNFIKKETVEEFTSYQFPKNDNRRGLGFDKPMLEYEDHLSNCKSASPSSFGHSGFTGTYAWADPETGLVYVFLSNRIYPSSDNRKIGKYDIRTNIHQLFYDAIESK